MARKNNKGKPTRKDIDNAIKNLYSGLQYLSQKIEYIENYAKSTEMAFDLYIKFKKDEKAFTEVIEKYNEDMKKKEEEKKELVSEEKSS